MQTRAYQYQFNMYYNTTLLIVRQLFRWRKSDRAIEEKLCSLFRITDPMARGVAIGTSSHAIGTAKALEMGQVEGAISSLSIAVAGILTAILCPAAVHLLMI